MEMYSNNIIKGKIDSVDTLPEGYTPNLSNKWELLEAGLVKQKEKKPLLLYIRQTASVAALLLLFGGVGLFLIKQVQTPPAAKPATSFNTGKQADKKEAVQPKMVAQNTSTQAPQKSKHPKTAMINTKPALQAEEITEEPLMAFIDSPKVLTTVAVDQIPAKAKRFTEIDFNEPIVSVKTSMENVVASQKFKFKIGFSAQSNTASSASPNRGNSIGLVKQIN